ncbi:MAG: structural cement protein Gp24 [Cetobacterium sp.]
MSELQQQVREMSIGKVGAFVNSDIYKVFRAKASVDTTIGKGVFSSEHGVVSNVKGTTDIFTGIAMNTMTSLSKEFFGGGLVVPAGETLDINTIGDIYVEVPTGTATYGQFVFVSDTNGNITTANTIDPQAGKTITDYRVIKVEETNGTNDLVYISNTLIR